MFIIGEWIFEPATRRLLGVREEKKLSPKAARVLEALVGTPRHVWTREALLDRVWPDVTVGEEVLTHAIAELRRSFEDDFRSPSYIETVHKGGYRLLKDVEWADTLRDGDRRLASPDGSPHFLLESYGLYLEAEALLDRGQKSNMRLAAAKFGQVVDSDPAFAPARVGLAKSLAFLRTYYEPNDGDLSEALTHVRAAQRSEWTVPEAYAVEGLILAVGGRFDAARKQMAHAIRLKPHSGETHYLIGRACFAELNITLAAPMLERAAALRPDDYHALMLAGKAREMLGQTELARRNFARVIERATPLIHAYPGDSRALCAVARSHVHLGSRDRAWAALGEAGPRHEPCYHKACTFARIGETDTALDMLESSVEQGWNHASWLERDPDFRGLRHHPRLRRIAGALCRG